MRADHESVARPKPTTIVSDKELGVGVSSRRKETCFRDSLELSLPLDGGEFIILVVTLPLLKSQYTCHTVSKVGKIIIKNSYSWTKSDVCCTFLILLSVLG